MQNCIYFNSKKVESPNASMQKEKDSIGDLMKSRIESSENKVPIEKESKVQLLKGLFSALFS